VTVEAGNNTLVVGASGVGTKSDITSSPIGTGELDLGYNSTLTTPSGTCVTILNPIYIGNGEGGSVYVGGNSSTLTLLGNISEGGGPTALVIQGNTDLEGCNSYSGGTTVDCNVTLTVGTDTGIGTGQLTANSNSTVNFTSCSPNLNSPILNGATVNFTNESGSPVLNDLTLMCGAIINLEGGSTPTFAGLNCDNSSSDRINLGVGGETPATQLTIEEGTDPKFNGVITGNGSVTLTSTGSGAELDLENANTYTGGTTVNSNFLLVADNDGALGLGPLTLNSGSVFGLNTGVTIANPITLNNGAFIGGYGSISPALLQPITIQTGSGIVGGRGTFGSGTGGSLPVVGNLTFGTNATVTFGSGGEMEFSLMDASGTAGALSWSSVNVANLNVASSDESPFTISLVGVGSNQQTIGTAGTFDTTLTYNWTFLTSTTPITGFTDSNQFSIYINPSNFSNTVNGSFSVVDTGSTLVLNFTPVPEPSTWVLMIGGVCMLVGAAVRRRRRA
jgi:autotransporter-associated beta strand protein